MLDFIQRIRVRYPGLVVEQELYEKQHGGTFLIIHGKYTICRIYGRIDEFDAFSFQYKVGKQGRTIRVTSDENFARALLKFDDLMERRMLVK